MTKKDGKINLLSPYAALILNADSKKILVISDLHIGWEISLIEEGIYVPSQTSKLIEKLKRLIALEKPDSLLILGDVKHTVAKIETEEWRDVPRFFEEICEVVPQVQIVPGVAMK